jgi:MFS family permease
VSAPRQFSRPYLAFAMAVLFCANLVNYLDRQVLSALEREVVAAFELTKAEFGGLWSAFTLGYMAFAPVLGWAASRWSRTRLFGTCVAVWSFATIGSGLAPDTTTLYFMRFVTGVGEAGCVVMGPALAAEYASERSRGRLLAIYSAGMPLGGTLGYATGGMVGTVLEDWRTAMLLAGIPGIILSILLATLREPRAEPSAAASMSMGTAQRLGFGGYFLLLRSRPMVMLMIAQTFAVIMLVPMLHFCIEFFQSDRGMTKLEATTTFGMTALVAGISGSLLAGFLGDRLVRYWRSAYARVAACAYILAAPAIWVGFNSHNVTVSVLGLGFGATCMFASVPAGNTAIANLVPAQQRAMAFALTVFATHLLGDMVTPPLFGAIADEVGTEHAFKWLTLAMVGACAACIAAARAIDRLGDRPYDSLIASRP